MKRFEIIKEGGAPAIRVTAPTFPGLAVTALRGMFAAVGIDEGTGDDVQREFNVEGAGKSDILSKFLSDAASQAKANGEWYVDVNFTLITDKKAIGFLSGKKSASKGVAPGAARAADIMKNGDGEWETIVTFA